MAGRLIALDKVPGVRPIAMGEVLRRLIAKCVLSLAKGEASEACEIDQLCGGLQNRTVMLWVIRHEWPSVAQLLPTSCHYGFIMEQ